MSTIQLTPTQHAILSHAIAHTDGKIEWFPDNIKGGARQKVLGGLFNRLKEAAEATAVAEPSVLYGAATCLDLTNAPSGLGDGGR